MQRVEGVTSVAVSLKEGLTVLELREGNTVTLAQLRTVIKNNGFVSRDANVVARGSLVGGLFEVRLSREQLTVRGQPEKLESDRWKLVVPAAK
jgi:copper chaperone CopZ